MEYLWLSAVIINQPQIPMDNHKPEMKQVSLSQPKDFIERIEAIARKEDRPRNYILGVLLREAMAGREALGGQPPETA